MSDATFISAVLFECAICWCAYHWQDELWNHFLMIKIYWYISCLTILWLMHFGCKYYRLTYSKPDDEAGVQRVIEFPCIWW